MRLAFAPRIWQQLTIPSGKSVAALDAAKKARIAINGLDGAGDTPLFKTIRAGRVEAVDWLLERKASVVKKNRLTVSNIQSIGEWLHVESRRTGVRLGIVPSGH